MAGIQGREQSYWLASTPEAAYPRLQEDRDVDVLIVGAGIAGLTAAYLLKQAGKTVGVIEKDMIGGSVSGHTTGKVTSQHNLIYARLKEKFGSEKARLYGRANEEALDRTATIIASESIDCDWARDDSYVYTEKLDEVGKLKEEAKVTADLGLPASFETETALPYPVQGAVRFSRQAKMHTRKYLLGLAAAVHGDGSFVAQDTKSRRIRNGKPCKITTSHATVTARDVIIATNVPYPLVAHGAYCALEYPMKSYIVAGETRSSLKGMYITSDSSASILPITSGGKRWLLVGGQSHIPGFTTKLGSSRYRDLAAFAADRFQLEVRYRWSTMDYLAYDDMPLVGRLYPWTDHVYVATAFMKWGLTNASVAASILADTILGKPNPYTKIFNSMRTSPITSIPGLMSRMISS